MSLWRAGGGRAGSSVSAHVRHQPGCWAHFPAAPLPPSLLPRSSVDDYPDNALGYDTIHQVWALTSSTNCA